MPKKAAGTSVRSRKAGRPAAEQRARPQVERRRRSAKVAVKKDAKMMQSDAGTQVVWGANQRRPSKV
jgi:hypothetical protein